MNKFLPKILYFLFFIPTSIFAQTTTRNYVRETVYKSASGDLSNPTKSQSTITYLDGLGRPVQTVAVFQGGNGEDIVSHITYDEFGRDSKKYAPYATPNTNNGTFRNDPFADAKAFHNSDEKPYSLSVYEPSPLNRILKQGGPGNAWGVSESPTQLGDNSVKFKYSTNGINEVKRFDAFNSDGKMKNGTLDIGGGLSFVGYYDEKQLWVTETLDENNTTGSGGNRTKEYKDKSGRVVLKKAYLTDAATLDTYYIYDDFGQLRAVFPPLLSGNLINTGVELTGTDLTNIKELAFLYCYDNEGRMTQKKVPGADYVLLTYNTTTDLLIATQDGNQRAAGVSSYITYDALNRVVETGVGSNWLTKTYYDGTNAGWSDAINQKSDYPLDNSAKIGMVTGGETRTINADGTYGASLPSRIYYDSRYRVVKTYKGYDNLLTGSTAEEVTLKRSYIGTVLEEKTVQFNGLDYLTILKNFQYDHAERLLSICHRITETASMKTREEVPHLLNWLIYDGLGRLQRKSMGKMPAKYLKINPKNEFAETQYYDYNIRNWLNSSDAYRLMDKDNYTSTSKGGAEKLNFSMELKYHNPNNFLKPQWNGNISQYTWNGGGYNLEYDGISRLISARGSLGAYFEEQIEYDNGGAGNGNITKLKRWTKAGTGYTSIDDLTYNYANGTKSNQLMSVNDASGQSAGYNNTSTSGDDFVYDNNGNLITDKDKSIKTITYNVLNLVGTVAGETTIGTGDLRNITQTYIWDAAGSKLKYKSGAGIEKIYIGVTEYANNTNNVIAPSRIATEEGHVALRTDWTENDPRTKYVYYYTVKDHLGSVRIVIDDSQDAEVHQRNNYSAFGMLDFGTEGQTPAVAKKFNDRYYNGKEQQDVVGWYDFGARMYNSELGRWMSLDRFAEKYKSLTPYQYGANDPIKHIDINGDSIILSGSKAYVNQVLGDLKTLQNLGDKVVRQEIIDLIKSPEVHKIVPITRPGNRNKVDDITKELNQIPTGTTTEYDPTATKNNGGDKRKPIVGLAHELSHAHDADKGITNFNTASKNGGDKMFEINAVNFENRVRAKTGDQQRTSYFYPIPKKYLKTYKNESE